MQILPGTDAFLQTAAADLFLVLQKFMLLPCMAPYFSRDLVEGVTGMQQKMDGAQNEVTEVTHKAQLFQSLCDNLQALPQPQQDVLHAIMLVFGPVLCTHHCGPAKLVQAWLCTLLCRV